MRQVLRFLGNRYGAAVSILVVIAVVVAFGKLVGGSRTETPLGSDQGPPPVAAGAPSGSSSAEPDDGVGASADAGAPPSTSPGAATPQTVAVDFAKAWLNHHDISAANWHKGIAKYSTKTLSDRLDGVDPGSVPADQMTGTPTVDDQQPSYVDVAIPCDAGTLVLRMVVVSGRWLADGVDWRRT